MKLYDFFRDMNICWANLWLIYASCMTHQGLMQDYHLCIPLQWMIIHAPSMTHPWLMHAPVMLYPCLMHALNAFNIKIRLIWTHESCKILTCFLPWYWQLINLSLYFNNSFKQKNIKIMSPFLSFPRSIIDWYNLTRHVTVIVGVIIYTFVLFIDYTTSITLLLASLPLPNKFKLINDAISSFIDK